MACLQLTDKLDDYVDGALPAAERGALDAHVAECASCRESVARERWLRSLLKDYGDAAVPLPDDEYFDAALERAAAVGARQRRQRWLMTGFGGAVAASLAFWIVTSAPLVTPDVNEVPAAGIPAVTMTLAEPRTVNLVFSAEAALEDARLTIELPPGVELEGFPGRQRVSWTTSLRPGANLLPLTLIASEEADGELLHARLELGDDGSSFYVRITAI